MIKVNKLRWRNLSSLDRCRYKAFAGTWVLLTVIDHMYVPRVWSGWWWVFVFVCLYAVPRWAAKNHMSQDRRRRR